MNVIIPDLGLGAATDLEGNYIILNIPPGDISLNFSMIGYSDLKIENIKISIDKTTKLSVKLNISILQGAEIIVRDEKLIKHDLTNSEALITSDELEVMPVTDVNDVIKLQGGVTQDAFGGIHIRGGRSSEVSYMVDGVSMTDSYNGGLSVAVENNTIQELQVISGAFNAEYGRAMSGIINMVTKDGSNNFEGGLRTFFGDHISYDPIYRDLEKYDLLNQNNLDFNLSGPIIKNRMTFFISGRYYKADGWLSGLNTFDMYGDTLDVINYKPMNWINKWSFQSKLTYNIKSRTKLRFKFLINEDDLQDYDHYRQMVNEGRNTQFNIGKFLGFNLSHTFSPRSFIDINVSQYSKEYRSNLFRDPYDKRYIKPDSLYYAHLTGELPDWVDYGTNYYPTYSFSRWGVDLSRFNRQTIIQQIKFDYTNQINNYNQIKIGFDVKKHELELDSYSLLDSSQNDKIFTPLIPELGATIDISNNPIYQLPDNYKLQFTNDIPSWVTHFHVNRTYYKNNPIELSAYIQDKIEYGDMIVNIGLRYDYFDANSWIPTNPHEPYIQNPRDPHLDFLLDSLGLNALLNINWSDTSHYIIDYSSQDTLWYSYADYGDYQDMYNGIWDSNESFDDVDNDGFRDSDESFTDLSSLYYKKGWFTRTDIKTQFSPRFGIAYPISDEGVIHFSYGYFYQIPQFENLFRNPGYKISEGSGTFGVFGNPNLDPQKTISYEIGLQQEIRKKYKIELTGYFRDIRDWVSTGVPINLGGGAEYYTFINKDYSNVRGILFALDRKYSNLFSWHLDYTFQIVEGSNSNPEEEFGALLANSEPSRNIIPLDWDQRHSLNISLFYGKSEWGINTIAQYGSGYPYTPYYLNNNENISTFNITNSMRKRSTINFDLKAFRNFKLYGLSGKFIINIYNIFDTRNEVTVWADTGRSNQTSEQKNAENINNKYPEPLRPNSIQDYFNHPEWYSSPRQVQMGVEFKW